MRGSTQFQMPALDGIEMEPKLKTALDDLGRQLTAQFTNRTPEDEARYHMLLYTPAGDAVYQVYIDAAGALQTAKLSADQGRVVKRNAPR